MVQLLALCLSSSRNCLLLSHKVLYVEFVYRPWLFEFSSTFRTSFVVLVTRVVVRELSSLSAEMALGLPC